MKQQQKIKWQCYDCIYRKDDRCEKGYNILCVRQTVRTKNKCKEKMSNKTL